MNTEYVIQVTVNKSSFFLFITANFLLYISPIHQYQAQEWQKSCNFFENDQKC